MADGGRSLAEIVAALGGDLVGDAAVRIHGVATLQTAGSGQASFLANPKYRGQLANTAAAVVAIDRDSLEEARRRNLNCIVSDNPYAYYARLTQWLSPPLAPQAGIHSTATLESVIPSSCAVGPHATVGARAHFGERVTIGAGCHVGDDVEIGDDTCLYPGAVVYPGCRIGQRGIVHAGAVIGADGFGFAKDRGEWIKIRQLGRVVIGDDVEIGANTTIDRGALDDTVIGNGVKLDNQIQVAHNVVIGDGAAIAGCVGIAGSARIGRRCTIGGGAIVLGHLELGDDVHVSAGTMVTRSLKTPGQYSGAYPTQDHRDWLKNAAQLKHLDALARRVRELEEKLSALEKK